MMPNTSDKLREHQIDGSLLGLRAKQNIVKSLITPIVFVAR